MVGAELAAHGRFFARPHTGLNMGAILLAFTDTNPEPWERRFRALAPQRDLRVWPDRVGELSDIAYACVWKQPAGVLTRCENLKAIFSIGAGVDHVFADPDLPAVPIARIVDRDLTMRMGEYVVLHVLMHHRFQRGYDAQQRERLWRENRQPAASAVTVGIMGFGVLGRHAGDLLRCIGFKVIGWSRTPKSADRILTFHGNDGLDVFLAQTDILVCLLPHTKDTVGMIDGALLRKLRRDGALGGPFLINAGRGPTQVGTDILECLNDGTLAGATLDVFETEPLPPESPLWSHPRVTVTPHNAAATAPSALARNILDQIERFEAGEPLQNLVDRQLGY
jgi:glyoxylate/hydroxypyruvate reductase